MYEKNQDQDFSDREVIQSANSIYLVFQSFSKHMPYENSMHILSANETMLNLCNTYICNSIRITNMNISIEEENSTKNLSGTFRLFLRG